MSINMVSEAFMFIILFRIVSQNVRLENMSWDPSAWEEKDTEQWKGIPFGSHQLEDLPFSCAMGHLGEEQEVEGQIPTFVNQPNVFCGGIFSIVPHIQMSLL